MNLELYHVHGKTQYYKTVNATQIIKSFVKIIKFATVEGRGGPGPRLVTCSDWRPSQHSHLDGILAGTVRIQMCISCHLQILLPDICSRDVLALEQREAYLMVCGQPNCPSFREQLKNKCWYICTMRLISNLKLTYVI